MTVKLGFSGDSVASGFCGYNVVLGFHGDSTALGFFTPPPPSPSECLSVQAKLGLS